MKLKQYKWVLVCFLFLIFIVVILFWQQLHEKPYTANHIFEEKAKVLSVDNSEVVWSAASSLGYQTLKIKLLSGQYKGQTIPAINTLFGQLETDNIYQVGDKIVTAIQVNNNQITNAKAIDLYRQEWILLLFLFFIGGLLIYAGIIGIKALLSFILSLIVIWELLIKGILAGKNPLFLTTLTVIILTGIIVFLIAGFTKKGFSAFSGTIIGLIATLILTKVYGQYIGLFGLTQPYIQTLIVSGYYDLNIQQIFYSAIILGASGAAMDIAMDIAASMDELKKKKPEISMKSLMQSGFTVGKHVIGTMSTTLLLAYSGGYLTLLMLFMVKNSSFLRIINLKIVAAEIMRTLIGSIGLILVAPTTAVLAGFILSKEFKIISFKRIYKSFFSS